MEFIKERCMTFKYASEDKVEKSKELANLFSTSNIDFVCYLETGYYYPCQFTVRRSNKKWNDIMRLINSIKAAKYDFSNISFYITNEPRDVLGNIQEVLIS
jgi:hypothetical protein